MRILYISYSGMLEPLGQSQVLSYQERLAVRNTVHLISFERADDWDRIEERQAIAERIRRAGIVWHPLRYHQRPSAIATAWDILCGICLGLWLIVSKRIELVHARSYVPSVMALALKRITGVKYLFDMRGFWVDERVDGGLWPRGGRMYRIGKGFEKRFLLSADHVVSLTSAAVVELRRFPFLSGRMPPVTVIPTCADLDRFRLKRQGDSSEFVLGYVGSAGTWYMFGEVAACFRQLLVLNPAARLLVVNRNEHAYIREQLHAAGIPDYAFEVISAGHADMPALISRMSAGIFLIKPAFSKQASAPTKLAEFLGCGVPCLGNAGVGDTEAVLEGERVGIAIKAFDEESMKNGMRQLLAMAAEPGIAERCATVAAKFFSLEEGVRRYQAVYDELGAVK